MIKAIIFDLDGVLVDATEWHYEALNRALGLFGYRISREEHISTFNGLPTKKKLEMMQILPKLAGLISHFKKIYTAQVIREKCRPDIAKQDMLYRLRRKFRLACCSNAIKESVEMMLGEAEIADYFELVLGNDEIANPKPHPEIYLAAFGQLGLRPEECLVVEDAAYGIEAAKASGARVIAVRGYQDVDATLFMDLGVIRA